MAEVIARDGTWTFDYEIVRIVPGRDRGVHKLRQALGELTVPLAASGGEGTATFDGERVRLEWNWMAEESKRSAGAQQFAVKDLVGVEWNPTSGLENGYLRFRLGNATVNLPPAHDPSCLRLFWATQKETGTTVLVAAAVLARLPHPSGATHPQPALDAVPEAPDGVSLPAGAAGAGAGDEDPDALLRRLRELGELNRDGPLTDEEFAAAKQALLSRFRAANHPRSPG